MAIKTDQAARNNLLDEAPLFAGLDDFVLIKAERKNTETQQTDRVKEKKKQTVTQRSKQATSQTAPKVPKTQPVDPTAMLLSVAEMCALLKISRATLVRMDKSGQLPGRLKVGGSVRFHRETVETWLHSLINTHPTP
jgi:excisionase family DNA binding protein